MKRSFAAAAATRSAEATLDRATSRMMHEATSRTLVTALCVTLAASILIMPKHAFEQLPEAPVVWLTAGITLLLSVWIFRLLQSTGVNAWASAVSLTMLYYFYRYAWGAVIIYYWDQFPWEGAPWIQMRFLQHGIRSNIANGSELILLGGLGLALGLMIPAKSIARVLPSIGWSVDERQFQSRTTLYMPIAVIAMFAASLLPPSLQVLGTILGTAAYIVIILGSYWLFRSESAVERGRWTTFIIATAALIIPAGLLSGSVGEIVVPVVLVLFGYLLARGRFPWIRVGITVAVAMFTVFPALTVYKQASTGAQAAGTIEERIAYTRASLDWMGYRGAVESGLDRFVARLTQGFPALFARYYPDIYPYEMGRTFLTEFSTIIPRFAWPEKPSMSVELNRYSAGVGVIREGDGTSAVFDAVSEYHVNFGPAGVFFCSILHGLYLNVLSTWFSIHFRTYMAGILNIAIFIRNPEFFGLGQVIVSQITLIPVWLFILFLLSRSTKRAPVRAYSYSMGDGYAARKHLHSDL